MALSASCTAICTIVKTRVCCGGPPADPTTALALAFQSMTGSAMATPGNAKATAAASSQRLGIGKLEACARTEEGFIRDSFGRYSGTDQRAQAVQPARSRYSGKAVVVTEGGRGNYRPVRAVGLGRCSAPLARTLPGSAFFEARRLLGPCAGRPAPPIGVRHGRRVRAQRSASAAAW